jgi:creatinine amidohydrolase/Fe(II)-dependent formamide hydrolase-like protein
MSGCKAVLAILCLCAAWSGSASAQIFQLGEMNTKQIRALDRAKTVVLLPAGILEEHGPYLLPANTDGYTNAYLTDKLARAIVARPGWKIAVFPNSSWQ